MAHARRRRNPISISHAANGTHYLRAAAAAAMQGRRTRRSRGQARNRSGQISGGRLFFAPGGSDGKLAARARSRAGPIDAALENLSALRERKVQSIPSPLLSSVAKISAQRLTLALPNTFLPRNPELDAQGSNPSPLSSSHAPRPTALERRENQFPVSLRQTGLGQQKDAYFFSFFFFSR